MAATKLQLNWTTVSHNAAPITKVTAVTFSHGGALLEFAGDGDTYPTTILRAMSKPTASVTSADVATLMGIAPGTSGTFTATHKDAAAQTGGAIVYSLINAIAENCTANGPFGQFGSGTLTFRAYSSDGTTTPLSFTRT